MSKVAHYLQEHLVGEVMTSTDARRYFATDGSILQLAPALIAYPRTENDVRKTARFSWQLAERGRVIPITPRGSGTDQTGAALGEGILLIFPAHMNRILELDTKANSVTVEPGINFGKLQQTLHTHGRFLPSYPPSIEYSTVGGAIANNASGEKSVKYGSTGAYIQSLRVVLANGEVIETGRINKRELGKKLGLATFEGEIYRSLDTILEEQYGVVQRLERNVVTNNAGYNLLEVKHRDGSFDLTPLIAGSQGTLGIITEAVLNTEPYNPQTTLIMAQFDSLEHTQNAVLELRALSELPSTIELIDEHVLQQVHALNPNQLKEIVQSPFPAKLLRVYVAKTIYAGVNTEKWTAGTPVRCKFDGLVSPELWNRANRGKITIRYAEDNTDLPIVERIAKLEKFAKKNVYNADFPYRKVISCPTCQHALLGSASRGRLGKYYPAYHCTIRGHHFRVAKPEFDKVIDQFLEQVQISPERVDQVIEAVVTVLQKRQGQLEEQKAQSTNRREELEAQMKVIVDKMKLISSPTAIKYMEEDLMKLEAQVQDLDNHKEAEVSSESRTIPEMLTYVTYFMKHLKDLLIDHCNPVMRAHYFGVIFDQVPNFLEIKDGTANISQIPGVNELFKLAHDDGVSLVRTRGLEPPQDYSHYHLKVARLPFRHIRPEDQHNGICFSAKTQAPDVIFSFWPFTGFATFRDGDRLVFYSSA